MVHTIGHKEPKGNETANNIEDLRVNALDPAGEIDENTGEKQFLAWTVIKEDGEEVWKAVGRDGTVYKIKEDKPPVVKNYKLIITGEKEAVSTAGPPKPILGQGLEDASGNPIQVEEVKSKANKK